MTLKILGPNDPALDALKVSIERHPEIDAELVIIPWEDYRGALDKTLENYEYDAVCIPGHIWMPQLVEDGLIQTMEALFNNANSDVRSNYEKHDIYPLIQSECEYRSVSGKYGQYMLPLFTDGHIVFYRSDIIEELPETVTPNEIDKILQNIDLPVSGTKPFALKAHQSEVFLDFLPYFWAFGAELIDEQGNMVFASEKAVKALEYYVGLQKFCPVDTANFGNGEIVDAITTGKVAMVVSWGGQAAAIFKAFEDGSDAKIKTASFGNAWNATWGVSLPANIPAERKQEIFTALLNLMGKDCDALVTEIAGSPVRVGSYTQKTRAQYPWLLSQRILLETCKNLPVDPNFGKYLGGLYEEVHNAVTGKKSARKALQDALNK